jgi:hypothetical protein
MAERRGGAQSSDPPIRGLTQRRSHDDILP